MGEFLIGRSGWNYGDTPDKGGWIRIPKDYAVV
jgi:hypothetical protein